MELHEEPPSGEPLSHAIHSVDAALADNRITREAFEGAEKILGALRHETTEPLGRIQRREELARLLRRMAVWLVRSRRVLILGAACLTYSEGSPGGSDRPQPPSADLSTS